MKRQSMSDRLDIAWQRGYAQGKKDGIEEESKRRDSSDDFRQQKVEALRSFGQAIDAAAHALQSLCK